METPAQTCLRLVAALEDLAKQEAAALAARDFAGAVELQNRAAPLVNHLVAHAADLVDHDARRRLRAVQVLRNHSGEWLAEQIVRAQEDLAQMNLSRRRVAQIAPVYGGGPAPARSQLSAMG